MMTIDELDELLKTLKADDPPTANHFQILGTIPDLPKRRDMSCRQWRRNRYQYKLWYLILNKKLL
jgi:hypothetical protein